MVAQIRTLTDKGIFLSRAICLIFSCLFVYLLRTWPKTGTFVNKCGPFLGQKVVLSRHFCSKYSSMTFLVISRSHL